MTQALPTLPPLELRGALVARVVELVGTELQEVEALLFSSVDSDVPFIRETGQDLFGRGGKRIRPALLLLAAQAIGRNSRELITYAAVVELIHTATLVHDDILDHARLRRGRPTVNAAYGASRAVLLGDWLFTKAMQMAIAHGHLEALELLADATLAMTEGELLALARLGDSKLSIEEYFAVIERKTARLFAAACTLPALVAPQRSIWSDALARYGHALGLCFQLTDDLLDFTAREDELGKPVLSDLREGKLTLPLVLALPRLGPADRAKIVQVLTEHSFEVVAAEEILELVDRAGTLAEVAALARSYASQAQSALDGLPSGPAREVLELAPEYVIHRRA